jgi:hypothetical protein
MLLLGQVFDSTGVRNLRVTARRKVGKRDQGTIVGITLSTNTMYTSMCSLLQGRQNHRDMNMTLLYEPG